ncbi:MAG: HAMP domain-containing sensor histidine kinase [Alistipes sp.]|nr:HAMP domain-containing sensor histidine kinase [Alistipes sp.]
MNRRYFRNISLFVITALILLAAVQAVWVYRAYRNKVDDFHNRVETTTYKSIYSAFRMDAVPGVPNASRVRINLQEFRLFFEPNLRDVAIDEPYNIDIIDKQSGRTMMQYRTDKAIENPTTHLFDVDDDSLFALRLTINTPYEEFWGDVKWIILSSVAIVILLAAILVYLIRTMYRQRTLEQMRRDFTHNITHELKTPISVAVAATDAMRNFSADADVERRSRYLEMVEQQLTQLSTMVENILAVSVDGREVRCNYTRFRLLPLLQSTTQAISLSQQKSVEFYIDCSDSQEVRADEMHLRQILSTLIDNAIKYSGDSVKITLRAYSEADHTIIECKDNGLGISREHQRHIFEKFYRVPTGEIHHARGYGLGLYYAHKVIRQHGGDISVSSRIGKGSTFTIKLPTNGE